MLASRLFSGDPILTAVAEDRDRISRTRHATASAVAKVQAALLEVFDPGCLPVFGADGQYGDETAAAVKRFKIEILGVPAGQAIDDVGPQTVQELDRLMDLHERAQDTARRIALLDGKLGVPVAGFSSSVTTSGVHAHPTGELALAALHDAISRCSGEGSFIAIAGWTFIPDTKLVSGVTVGDALRAAAARGVRVRAMFTRLPLLQTPAGTFDIAKVGTNDGAVAFINALPNAAAIHDSWVLHHKFSILGTQQIGVHHQKIWVVFDGERLRAFCGGMDIHPTRTAVDNPGALAWHDVQVEVTGSAADDVYAVVRERWNNHPVKPSGIDLVPVPAGPTTRNQRARVFTTFGNPAALGGVNGPAYPFAPTGSKAIRQFLTHAIATAEQFIYLEDQYLIDESIGRDLAARMPALRGLVIVMPDDNSVNGELHQAGRRRKAALAPLLPFLDKIAIVNSRQFVHAKLWIFDDTIAMVGSANANRRGYAHDSEVALAFGDLEEPGAVQTMRTALWNTHLGALATAANAAPAASIATWKSATIAAGANVNQYVLPSGTDPNPNPFPASTVFTPDELWNQLIDPDCP